MQKRNMTMDGILSKILFYIMVMLIWVLAYKTIKFPSPVKVFTIIFNLAAKNNTLGSAVIVSMERIIVSYLISLVIGFSLGLLIVKLKRTGGSLSKLLASLQTMPNVCWVPFATLWFGMNERAISFVIIIGSVFAVAMATEAGIKNLNPLYLRVANMAGAKGWNLYRSVIIPAATPIIITGLKQGWAFAWRGLIAGEMMSTMGGLGQILTDGKKRSDINEIVAIMIVIIVVGLIFDKLVFNNIENRVNRKFGLIKN